MFAACGIVRAIFRDIDRATGVPQGIRGRTQKIPPPETSNRERRRVPEAELMTSVS